MRKEVLQASKQATMDAPLISIGKDFGASSTPAMTLFQGFAVVAGAPSQIFEASAAGASLFTGGADTGKKQEQDLD
jgi:hypothetical protein